MKLMTLLILSLLSLDMAAMLTGCTNQTEGDRTMAQGSQIQDAGTMIRQGEMLVANARADIARGETIKQQGNNMEGDHIIAEAKAHEKQGQELIDQGRKLHDKAK